MSFMETMMLCRCFDVAVGVANSAEEKRLATALYTSLSQIFKDLQYLSWFVESATSASLVARFAWKWLNLRYYFLQTRAYVKVMRTLGLADQHPIRRHILLVEKIVSADDETQLYLTCKGMYSEVKALAKHECVYALVRWLVRPDVANTTLRRLLLEFTNPTVIGQALLAISGVRETLMSMYLREISMSGLPLVEEWAGILRSCREYVEAGLLWLALISIAVVGEYIVDVAKWWLLSLAVFMLLAAVGQFWFRQSGLDKTNLTLRPHPSRQKALRASSANNFGTRVYMRGGN